jgi:hypothetical protein
MRQALLCSRLALQPILNDYIPHLGIGRRVLKKLDFWLVSSAFYALAPWALRIATAYFHRAQPGRIAGNHLTSA